MYFVLGTWCEIQISHMGFIHDDQVLFIQELELPDIWNTEIPFDIGEYLL